MAIGANDLKNIAKLNSFLEATGASGNVKPDTRRPVADLTYPESFNAYFRRKFSLEEIVLGFCEMAGVQYQAIAPKNASGKQAKRLDDLSAFEIAGIGQHIRPMLQAAMATQKRDFIDLIERPEYVRAAALRQPQPVAEPAAVTPPPEHSGEKPPPHRHGKRQKADHRIKIADPSQAEAVAVKDARPDAGATAVPQPGPSTNGGSGAVNRSAEVQQPLSETARTPQSGHRNGSEPESEPNHQNALSRRRKASTEPPKKPRAPSQSFKAPVNKDTEAIRLGLKAILQRCDERLSHSEETFPQARQLLKVETPENSSEFNRTLITFGIAGIGQITTLGNMVRMCAIEPSMDKPLSYKDNSLSTLVQSMLDEAVGSAINSPQAWRTK